MPEHEDPSPFERSKSVHINNWGLPEFAIRAPGRVNLIGEHTDYNDGFCLPMALPFEAVVSVSRSQDQSIVNLTSEGFGVVRIDVNRRDAELPAWAGQIAGVLWLLQAQGIVAGGWNGTVAADIPAGAGLSSSAAIEVAVIRVVLQLQNLVWSALEVAKVGQRAESEILGLPTGIMDQFISAGAEAGSASFMDCRTLTLTPAPLPSDAVIAILDTGTRRRLVDGEYGARRANCEDAAAELGVASLRDVDLDDLATLDPDSLEFLRAHHVVTENTRTAASRDAMVNGDTELLGQLMSESHESLRDDFDVSSPALDLIVEIAESAPGCFGARMTGGGFAGCAVALVASGEEAEFEQHITEQYSFLDDSGVELAASIWFCTPQAGASLHPELSVH